MVIWIAVFFLAFCFIAWLVMFPEARDIVGALLNRVLQRGSATGQRLRTRAAEQVADSSTAVRGAGSRVVRNVSRNRYLLIATVLLLCVPPALIFGLRQKVALENLGYDEGDATNSQILNLIVGEQLVPPPAPPPEVFVEAQAELDKSPVSTSMVVPEKIVTADRRWNQIQPDFQQRVLAIYKIMKDQYGVEMVLVEGFRSAARQAELSAGGKATRAGAGQSCHQYGLAVDSAPIRNGKLQWDMNDPWTRDAYFTYGRLAAEAGLEWGGNWRSIKDYVHLEQKAQCRAARKAAGY